MTDQTLRPQGRLPQIRPLPEQLAALLGPDLGGRGACAGLAPLHDAVVPGETDEQREARHHRARAVCAGCTVLDACAAARADLGPDATGMWAGHIEPPARIGRPPARPPPHRPAC